MLVKKKIVNVQTGEEKEIEEDVTLTSAIEVTDVSIDLTDLKKLIEYGKKQKWI